MIRSEIMPYKEDYSAPVQERLMDAFDEMVVYKDLSKGNIISSFKLPSFMRDWVLKRFQDEEGELDIEETTDFIRNFIPKKEQWKSIQNRIVTQNERVKLLGRITVNIDVKTQVVSFAMSDFGLGYKETVISPDVWETCSDALLRSEENWGIIELGYMYPNELCNHGRIELLSYKDFCPYSIDLDEFKDARSMFSFEEWVDIVLMAVDYNPRGYDSLTQKLAMIQRLLPFAEKNLNLIELAPPGTGKSYLFGQVSRYGWLVSGKSTRAQLIYNKANKREGVVAYKDYVALDEIREADYMKDPEMHSALQQIMENRKFKADDGHEVNVDAGIVFLGNIVGENQNEYRNMFAELPEPFHRTPFLDRLHGFIKGWDLPRMNEDMKAKGWALNSEYFCTIMHELREDASYRAIVEDLLEIPEKADTRDTEAIKRICTAYLKILFPQVRSVEDVPLFEFDSYCLQPAIQMRGIIIAQKGMIDPKEAGKIAPDIRVKGTLI